MSVQETRQLLRGAPYFPVTDLATSTAHYEQVLGFLREYVGGTRNGANIVYGPLVQKAYNMEEFAVRDRDGYVLGFGQALNA